MGRSKTSKGGVTTPTKYHTFNGKRYEYHSAEIFKIKALGTLKRLRKAGYNARILPARTGGYFIYKRKKD